MEPWRSPGLTGYSCDDFQSRATQSHLLLTKGEDLSLQRRPAFQTKPHTLDISSTKAQVVPDLLKALAILSDATVRTSAFDQDDLKSYYKS